MTDPIQAVLADTADIIESLDSVRREYCERGGRVGPFVVHQIYESAKTRYAEAAIEHMQRHLRIDQLAHCEVGTAEDAVAALREAAGLTPPADVEAAACRRTLNEFHRRLAEAVGSSEVELGVLINELVRKLERLKKLEDLSRPTGEAR